MKTRILWLSRHQPTDSQMRELVEMYSDTLVVTPPHRDCDSFRDGDEIVDRLRRGRYDDCVVVAPLAVIARLCEYGVRPLFAHMEVCAFDDPRCEVIEKERGYRFVGFERIERIDRALTAVTNSMWRSGCAPTLAQTRANEEG